LTGYKKCDTIKEKILRKGIKTMFYWFKNCKTCEEGKQLYRELAKRFHPDNGGTGEELKEIISEFKLWFEKYKNMGMISFKGKVETNDTLGDGVEHEEFYVDTDSIVSGLKKVIKLKVSE
jgi:hypothetical protein